MTKKRKIILFSPNIIGTKRGVNRIQPGHGIGLLATVLNLHGHEVYIRDTAMEGYHNQVPVDSEKILIGESDLDIADYLRDIKPDIVGISVVFSNLIKHAHTIAQIAKQVNRETKVIIGGNHITCAASDYEYFHNCEREDFKTANTPKILEDMQDQNIDFAMRGECDYAFLELVEALLRNKSPYKIKGLIHRNKNNSKDIIINPKPEAVPIENLPSEARHKMNLEGYFKVGLFHSPKSKSKRVLTVMASRGCPEKCTFCSTPEMWSSRIRWRKPKDIYKEILEAVKKYNIGEIQFEDDSLTANRKNLEELCDLLKPLGIPWCTPNGIKVNYQKGKMQYELFKRMHKSGCYQVTLGCESGSQRVLDEIIHKNLKLKQIKPTIENAKSAGLLVHTFWIVGYPGETRAEMEETIEFAGNSCADSYSVAILAPLPGTPIYRQVIKENLWWDENYEFKDILYSNSLIKVDGFNGPKEFQNWVHEKNLYLNKLLAKREPKRFKIKYGVKIKESDLAKQT